MHTTPNVNEELRRLDDAINNKLIPSFTDQKQPQEVFVKKVVLKNFGNYHRKTPVLKALLQYRTFPVKFQKVLRTLILMNICERLLLTDNKLCGNDEQLLLSLTTKLGGMGIPGFFAEIRDIKFCHY